MKQKKNKMAQDRQRSGQQIHRLKSRIVLGTTLVLASSLFACNDLIEDIIENEIDRGQVAADPDKNPDENIDTPQSFSIDSVTPSRGESSGGDTVILVGVGFEQGVDIYFGNNQIVATDVTYLSANRLRVIVPKHTTDESPEEGVPGVVGLKLIQGEGPNKERADLPNAYTYFDPVEIEAVSPSEGSTLGYTTVFIRGAGFLPGTTVQFGAEPPITATYIDESTLSVRTPPSVLGPTTVSVANINGVASLSSAFRYYDPVRLYDIFPFAAPVSGDATEIQLSGRGLVEVTSSRFGSETIVGNSSPQEDALSVSLDFGTPQIEGLVDVEVNNNNGAAALRDAFIFFDPADTTPRIVGSVPAAAPPEGQSTIGLVTVGFNPETLEVSIGGNLSTCVVHDGNSATCEVPPSNSGGEEVVDIVVQDGLQSITLVGGLEYIDLQIDVLQDNRGSIAGGTWIRAFGSGFRENSEVFVNGILAQDISYISDGEIQFWTPAHPRGEFVDVGFVSSGLQKTVVDGFEYYNPSDTAFFTHGGPIENTVNIVVTERDASVLLAGAYVSLITATGTLGGTTDDNGLITFSGPEVVAPVDVHASLPDFGGASILGVDASSLTLIVDAGPEDPPEPLPECPPPSGASFPPPGAPLVRGVVKRIKDEFNTGDDTVLVTTTHVNFALPLPNPGPDGQLTSQGEYQIFVRSGDMVALAIAGYPNEQLALDAHAMGFFPFLYTQPSSTGPCEDDPDAQCAIKCEETLECALEEQCIDVGAVDNYCVRVYDDVDILVDTPLVQALTIDFNKAPLELNDPEIWENKELYARVWYDFDAMGVYSMATVQGSDVEALEVAMPVKLPTAIENTPFHINTRVRGPDVLGGFSQTQVSLTNFVDTTETIVAEPFLRIAKTSSVGSTLSPESYNLAWLPSTSTAPSGQFTQHYAYSQITVPLCEDPNTGQVASRGLSVIDWFSLAPGEYSEMYTPLFPFELRDAHLDEGRPYNWQIQNDYVPDGADFNRLRMGDLRRSTSTSIRLPATGFVAPSSE